MDQQIDRFQRLRIFGQQATGFLIVGRSTVRICPVNDRHRPKAFVCRPDLIDHRRDFGDGPEFRPTRGKRENRHGCQCQGGSLRASVPPTWIDDHDIIDRCQPTQLGTQTPVIQSSKRNDREIGQIRPLLPNSRPSSGKFHRSSLRIEIGNDHPRMPSQQSRRISGQNGFPNPPFDPTKNDDRTHFMRSPYEFRMPKILRS